MKIEIWSKDNCPQCDAAIKFASNLTENLIVKKLGTDFEREDILETFPGARTFPQIIVDEEKIGGWDQLRSRFTNNN